MTRPRLAMDLRLEHDGLVLRPWQPSDHRALLDLVRGSLAELSPWLDWCRAGYDDTDAAAWIAFSEQAWVSGREYPFAVLDAAGTLLGSVGLNQFNNTHRLANLGYWTGAPFRGQAIAARASRIICTHAFSTLPLHRIEVVILPENQASQRVAEKLGARFECTARNRLFAKGKPSVALVYGLVPEDLADA